MKKLVGLVLTASLLMTGCGLLPAEEEMRSVPIAQTIDEEYFTTVAVKKGTVRSCVYESCTYQYQQTQNLSFSVGGEAVKETYVKLGQKVHAGDVLAELSTDSVQDQIDELTSKSEQLEAEVTYYDGLVSIEEERVRLAKRYGKKYDESKLEQLRKTYDEYADNKYINDLRLGELETEINGRRLVAGIDGTVDFIKEIPAWLNGRINAFDKYISIHSDRTGFIISTMNDGIYEFGDVYDIVTKTGESYACEVVKIIRPTGGMGSTRIVLEPISGAEELEIGTEGNLMIETDRMDDVLYIPTSALRMVDDKPAVYVIDAGGFRSLKFIEIGLSVEKSKISDENRTAVLSGLSLGDSVITK